MSDEAGDVNQRSLRAFAKYSQSGSWPRHSLPSTEKLYKLSMVKTQFSKAMAEVQAKIRPNLSQSGFRVRGRTFTRTTVDGLTQVVQFQMGRFDPPGAYEIPGFRDNLYGKFTVNIGVYIPEVAIARGYVPSKIQECDCPIRVRLGNLGPRQVDTWWNLLHIDESAADVWRRLERDGLPFLARFENRDAILKEWAGEAITAHSSRHRIDSAIILAARGQHADSRALLMTQARTSPSPKHLEFLRELAGRLGLDALEF